MKLSTSVVMPVVRLVTTTPMASAEALTTAMAASAPMRLFSVIRSSPSAARITTGMDTGSGAQPQASAMLSAPKDTWLSPSPIMEYRFSTSGTPSSAAHSATRIPTTNARRMNG